MANSLAKELPLILSFQLQVCKRRSLVATAILQHECDYLFEVVVTCLCYFELMGIDLGEILRDSFKLFCCNGRPTPFILFVTLENGKSPNG
jgi:hypothetical protein